MSADYPLKEIELNRLTNEVLATLPQFRIIDKVTVIRACQHMAFVAHPGSAAYLERLWNHILALADLVERAGQFAFGHGAAFARGALARTITAKSPG